MTHYLVGDTAYWHTNKAAVEHGKKVVVIDPTDKAQLDRLAYHLARIGGDWPRDLGAVRMVIEAMILPPRPREPQGLGAVVLDSRGQKYVRALPSGGPPKWRLATLDDRLDPWAVWSAIDAVEVLSEGVPA